MVHVTSTEIGENIKCSLILIKLWSFWNVYEQQTALSEILAECRYCRYFSASLVSGGDGEEGQERCRQDDGERL